MRSFKNISIRQKQIWSTLLTTTVALVLACSAFVTFEVLTFRKGMVQNLSALAEIVGDDAALALNFNDPKEAVAGLTTLQREPNISRACIYDTEGKVFAEYDRNDKRIPLAPPALQQAGYHFGPEGLVLFDTIEYKSNKVGTICIVSDLNALYEKISRYATITTAVLIVSLLVAFLMAGRLQCLVSNPILGLVQSAQAVARDKDYSVRVARRSGDEIGILIDSFNEMLGQIQERDAGLQRAQADLEVRVAERTQELANSLSLLNATLESTADGILAVNTSGKSIHWNERFVEIWRLPREVLEAGDDLGMLPLAADQLKDPAGFLAGVENLYAHPELESFDVIEFNDGRIIERGSKPQRVGNKCVGRVWNFRDVTEQRKAEKELRWKTVWLEAQLDSSNDGIIVMDAGGERIYQNQRVIELWRVPAEIAIHPNHELQIKYAASVTQDPEHSLELIHKIHANPDATVHDEIELTFGTVLDRYSYPLIGKDGVRYGRIWSFRDLTERKRAEEELKWKSALLEAMMDSSQDAMLVVDATGQKLIYQNQGVLDLWNVPPEIAADTDARRQIEFALKAARYPEKIREETAYLEANPDAVFQSEQELKDGRIVEPYSYPIKGKDGVRLARMWQFRDITSRKQVEIELARERDLLETLLNNSPDYIYFKGLGSQFLRCSRSLANRFNVEAAELVGKTDFDLFREDHARDAYNDEQEIIRTGKPVLAKVERESRRQGQESWAITSKMPLLNEAGEIIGTFGISKDITEIKEAEEKLAAANRQLLEISRMAGMAEVATSVLHNVGNVLNSVNVSCSIVADRVRKSRSINLGRAVAMMQEHEQDLSDFLTNDPKGRQLPSYLSGLAGNLELERTEMLEELSQLISNVDHIKEIVAMQQSYAKVSGVHEILPATDLVEDALRMNGAAFERHHVKILRQFQPAPPVVVERHKVLQILINLFRNAEYACDEGGGSDKRITIGIEPAEAGQVKIFVSDNGIGIPVENLTRIFQHGFTTRKNGHGFGLHSGALAARELGGVLSVSSAGPGCGATFSLTLPCKQKENA